MLQLISWIADLLLQTAAYFLWIERAELSHNHRSMRPWRKFHSLARNEAKQVNWIPYFPLISPQIETQSVKTDCFNWDWSGFWQTKVRSTNTWDKLIGLDWRNYHMKVINAAYIKGMKAIKITKQRQGGPATLSDIKVVRGFCRKKLSWILIYDMECRAYP